MFSASAYRMFFSAFKGTNILESLRFTQSDGFKIQL